MSAQLIKEIGKSVVIWGFIVLAFYLSLNPDRFGDWMGVMEHHNTQIQIKLSRMK